ncbi:MAG TPA: alkaline phosphatase family protein [Nocardioidaceae bacterium]|nr:alkaline phosphatase family protein [Nocardioidaceae bacterium]
MCSHRSRPVPVIIAAAAVTLLLAGCGQAPTHDRIVDLADRTPAPAGGTAGHTPVSSPVHTTAATPRHTKVSHSPHPHKPPKTTSTTTTSPSPSPTPTSSSSAPAPTKSSTPPPATGNEGVPAFDHVLVVVEENEAANAIYGNSSAPYINSLADNGAKFTDSFAITHPSEPNYLALFSGSTQGVTDDSCPHSFGANNLGNQLLASGSSFVGYAEGLPSAGSLVCNDDATNYARRHAPWTNFSDLPASQVGLPFSKFPTSYANLPAVSWVIPNLCDDMHGDTNCSGSVSTADTWLKQNLGAYATWAKSNNSLLIVTFDEGVDATNNQIATIMYGARVQPGSYSAKITHYSVLRMIEDANSLPYLGAAQNANPVPDIWN